MSITAFSGHPGAGMTYHVPQLGENTCPFPAANTIGESLAALAAGGQGVGIRKGPNLDLNDKLVKRGSRISWGGLRGNVLRARTGRCLVEFPGDRPQWVTCRSVQVIA